MEYLFAVIWYRENFSLFSFLLSAFNPHHIYRPPECPFINHFGKTWSSVLQTRKQRQICYWYLCLGYLMIWIYMVCSQSIKTRAVFTKTGINNEWDIHFLPNTTFVQKVIRLMLRQKCSFSSKYFPWHSAVIPVRLKLYLPRQKNNESNVPFLQNTPLSIQHPYSSKFSIGQSTSKTPLLIWCETASLYFF